MQSASDKAKIREMCAAELQQFADDLNEQCNGDASWLTDEEYALLEYAQGQYRQIAGKELKLSLTTNI